MPSRFHQFFAIACLITTLYVSLAPSPYRRHLKPLQVACVGDSITYGLLLEDRLWESYPAQLSSQLGEAYEVKNFGVNGATISRLGDLPYRYSHGFQKLVHYNPDIVIAMLGSNDTKPNNWRGKEAFERDLKEFLLVLRQLPSHPTIYLCCPSPLFTSQHSLLRQDILESYILPSIRKVARETSVSLIDLHDPFTKHEEFFPDSMHPNAQGARRIAGLVAAEIRD